MENINLDPAEELEYDELAASTYSHVAEIIKDTETTGRLFVSVANAPLDVVLGICETIDEIKEEQPNNPQMVQASAAYLALPFATDAAWKLIAKKLRIAKLQKKGAVIVAKGKVMRFSKVLLEHADFHDAMKLLKGGGRVAAMRKFKNLVDAGVMSPRKLAQMYDLGIIPRSRWYNQQLGKSPYRILEEGVTLASGATRKAWERTHHCYPIGNYKFKDGKTINLEREFVARGIDPNDGFENGRFLAKRHHTNIIHGGTKKIEYGSGGAWNAQWANFFRDYPRANAAAIRDFKDDLYRRVGEAEANAVRFRRDLKWEDVDWLYKIERES